MGRPQITLEPANQITWDDLCRVETKTVALAKYGGKTITYRTMVPLDVIAGLQAQHMQGNRKEPLQYMLGILKYVFVGPAIENDTQARAVVKADSAVMLQIIGDVTTAEDAAEIRDALEGGEGLGEDSPA